MVSLAMLGISGCDVFLGPDTPVGKGTLSIGFGEDGGRARSVSEETLTTLRYDLVLTGPDRQKITASLAIGQSFNEQVALGEWLIEAKAFAPDGGLFGTGSKTVTVRAGDNPVVLVPMTVVSVEGALPVSAFDLTALVTAPVRDATPVTTAIDTGQYTGTVTWQKGDGAGFNGDFAPSTIYRAVVNLTATTGYTFAGVNANRFSHDGAETVTNAAGSGNAITVTINFPATAVAEIEGGNITLSFNDAGEGAFTETYFTLKQGGETQSITVNLASSSWSSPEWRVDGVLKGSGQSFLVNADQYSGGRHTLQATVMDGSGNFWSKTLPFTVTSVVMGIALNEPGPVALLKNETKTLVATVSPIYAENRTVNWTSSVPSVATVNGGVVTAVGRGSAVITVASADDPSKTAVCTVTVTDAGSGGITLNFNDDGKDAFTNTTFIVRKSGTPADETISLLPGPLGAWLSAEWRVDGVLKGTGTTSFTVYAVDYTVGSHILQVTAQDSGNNFWSKTLRFTVSAPVTGITLNKSNLALPKNETGTLIATISPFDAENKVVDWSSSVPSVATVSGGVVTAVGPGSAVITAASAEDPSKAVTCTVTVTDSAGGITLNFNDDGKDVFVNTTFTVKNSGTPASETINLPGSWVSQEWRVDGVLKGTGTTTFTVNAADYTVGGHILQVTVKDSDNNYWSKTLRFTVSNE
jgi:uncharacterized protein YjdB